MNVSVNMQRMNHNKIWWKIQYMCSSPLELVMKVYIVECQAHPALVKIGLVVARLFIFNSLLVRLHLVKVLRTACVCYKRLFVNPPWLD